MGSMLLLVMRMGLDAQVASFVGYVGMRGNLSGLVGIRPLLVGYFGTRINVDGYSGDRG